MITRNCFGKITPRIGKYVVEKRHDGKWEINKEEYCLKTTAVVGDGVLMWIGIEPFDSMVKAYAWLKKHIGELLQEVSEMIELKDLLEENETIVTFHLCNEYWSRNAITVKRSDDISGALEMTLHRILEAGGTENDVKRIMGAEIPTGDELKELEEFDEFRWIDLGYVLPGLIDLWEESEVD